jgi:hypothetical protein
MTDPQHKRPIWLGVLLASLAPAIVLLSAMFFSRTGNPSLADMIRTGGTIFLFTLPVALVVMLTLGLPYVLWLRKRGFLNSVFVCIGATAIGSIAFALLALILSWDHRIELAQFLYGAGFGLASGIAFCVGSGPNNSFKPMPLRGTA